MPSPCLKPLCPGLSATISEILSASIVCRHRVITLAIVIGLNFKESRVSSSFGINFVLHLRRSSGRYWKMIRGLKSIFWKMKSIFWKMFNKYIDRYLFDYFNREAIRPTCTLSHAFQSFQYLSVFKRFYSSLSFNFFGLFSWTFYYALPGFLVHLGFNGCFCFSNLLPTSIDTGFSCSTAILKEHRFTLAYWCLLSFRVLRPAVIRLLFLGATFSFGTFFYHAFHSSSINAFNSIHSFPRNLTVDP